MGTREKCKNENIIFTFSRYSEQCKYGKLPKKKKKKFLLPHLRINGNFFQFFSIQEQKKNSLRIISRHWTLYPKQNLLSDNHSQLNYSLTYREKGWRVFEYSRTYDDICSKIIPIIFAKQFTTYTSSFHLLLLFRRAIGKKGMKRERRRGKITIRDRVSSL